ncbi:MAG: hypothetical protein JNM21_17370 [Taibaiella sp.]|nr:hypothetical protein [Taibaiella sp.]
MKLKQENKIRIELTEVEWGEFDYDGCNLALYRGNLYSGYVVYDRFPNKNIENEVEYKNGSQIGWENEYNECGHLIYSCLSLGQTTLETFKYDEKGKLQEHWKSVDDEYYDEIVTKYKLLD